MHDVNHISIAISPGTRILALTNQKGGVGKTTTTINLATALAACGKRVLIIDLDPQGNASTGLGIGREGRKVTSYDILVDGASVASATIPTIVPGMVLIPSSLDLSGAELELVAEWRREYRLRDALESVRNEYEYILIDCPPSLNLLTLNALVAADAVIVPLQCEFYALEGLTHLLQTIEMGRKDLHITVTQGGEASEIWCRDGEVVDARSVSLDGEAAFYRILTLRQGTIVAEFSAHERPRRIDLSQDA